MRAVYLLKGVELRKSNYFKHIRKLPVTFYSAKTGILPVDNTIKKIRDSAYAHHIERLMLLGNYMLLNEYHPDEVYKWFMEVFIDAYDWVMVTNVYGMSQFSDAGIMSTKPYISGSNYILKMSNYKKGLWCDSWDALYWHFIEKHQSEFSKNPRMWMIVQNLKKINNDRINYLKTIADKIFTDDIIKK